MRLLLINPNISESVSSLIGDEARRTASPGTDITVVTAPFGVAYIETRFESLIGAYAVAQLAAEHYPRVDAIVVAAFGHLGRRSDGPQMERFLGPLGTLFANRFYLDQIEAALVVRPLQVLAGLAAAFDRYAIDGLVDFVGRIPVALGAIVRRSQSGLLQRYAVGGALGALLLIAALWWRLTG